MPAQQQQERRLECRRFEVAGTTLTLHQDVSASRALQPLAAAAAAALAAGEAEQGSRRGEERLPGGEPLSLAGGQRLCVQAEHVQLLLRSSTQNICTGC